MVERSEEEQLTLLDKARETLTANASRVGFEYTPPSWPHYPHIWLWDGAFHAIVWSFLGDLDQSKKEIQAVLGGQREGGFIPNMRFHFRGRRFDPERQTFLNPAKESDYTQPPVLALSALMIYQAYKKDNREEEGKNFLNSIYRSLVSFYEYFEIRSGEDNLIACIHPHETGRDSDPIFDRILKGVYPNWTPKVVKTGISYLRTLKLGFAAKRRLWRPEAMRDLFWLKDVMFNCLYADNLYCLAEIANLLGKTEEAENFKNKAEAVEKAVLDRMWSSEKKMFFSLFGQDSLPIEQISVASLFPIVLPKIDIEKLEAIINLLEDPNYFNTEFMIPSVPLNDPNYDPSYKDKRIWRGPVWINMNWYLVFRGLIKQISRFSQLEADEKKAQLLNRMKNLAKKIASGSLEMVRKSGFREFYNPETGEGYRVKNFGWSTLAVFFESDELRSIIGAADRT
ncbi:MAG: hypothetical protein QHH09_04135 [Microgenomates group bacterium]|nr:hypothetical protein [Microgenomates group bacterium]